MEKRSEDDKPSSALSREIQPGSEKCCDWSLSGGSDSETHKTYESICVKRQRGGGRDAWMVFVVGLLCVVFAVLRFRA